MDNCLPYQEIHDPTKLDDVDLDLFKWTTFLDCASLGEDSNIAPPYSTMGEPLICTYSLDHYLQEGGKHQAYDIFQTLLLNTFTSQA